MHTVLNLQNSKITSVRTIEIHFQERFENIFVGVSLDIFPPIGSHVDENPRAKTE